MSPVIELAELTAAHGRGAQARRVLAPTSFCIERGESVAVIGRSGAGKSTLAEVVLGLRPPEQGHIIVDGEHWCSHRVRPARKRRHLVQGVQAALRHEAGAVEVGDPLAGEPQPGLPSSGQGAQQHRLAAAGGPGDHHSIARVQVEFFDGQQRRAVRRGDLRVAEGQERARGRM